MLNDDTVTSEVTDPQTPASSEPAGDPTGGAQVSSEPATTTPPPDKSAGSEPTIPLSRFNEVIRERNELRQRFQQPPAPQQPQQPAAPPKQEDFATYEEYIDARADFRAEQKFQNLRQQERQQSQAQQVQDRAVKAHTNFAKKLGEAVAKDPTIQAILDSAPSLRPDLSINLMEYPNPIDLGKHLAMNPDLVYEMNNLPPDLAVQRMWGIGQSLAGSTTPPQTRVSKAPPPISPVGSGKTTVAQAYSDGMSQEEYNAAFKPIW